MTQLGTLQQLQTIQSYIRTMFDGFNEIDIDVLAQEFKQFSQCTEIHGLLQQNVSYGKKIIQLSDKFTAKYRKDHFVDRKDIEQKIKNIYAILCSTSSFGISLDEMVQQILIKIQNNNAQNFQSPLQTNNGISGENSRFVYGQNFNSRANSVGLPYLHELKQNNYKEQIQMSQPGRFSNVPSSLVVQRELEQNAFERNAQKNSKSKLTIENLGLNPSESQAISTQTHQKRRGSINKSKISKKSVNTNMEKNQSKQSEFNAKTVLMIKNHFDMQENQIKQIFHKIQNVLMKINVSVNFGVTKMKINESNLKIYENNLKIDVKSERSSKRQEKQSNFYQNKGTLQGNGDSFQNLKISKENLAFTKCVDQMTKQNIKDFVKANIQNSVYNLNKINDVFDVFWDYVEQKGRQQLKHLSEKFSLYISQINKRQQLFSFTVSKMQQYLSNLRNNIENEERYNGFTGLANLNSSPRNQSSLEIVKHLEEVSNKFYDIFPSYESLKDLKVSEHDENVISSQKQFLRELKQSSLNIEIRSMEKRGFKCQQTQVSLPISQKTTRQSGQASKKTLLEIFKINTKVNEIIENFMKNWKFKKNIEVKQVQKLTELIRDSFPKKSNLNALPSDVAKQAQKYEEQIKKIYELHQKKEKQLQDSLTKSQKKHEKQLSEYEKTMEQLLESHRKQLSEYQNTIKKQQKKIQSQKSTISALEEKKSSLEKSLGLMRTQLDGLQNELKRQYQKYNSVQESLLAEKKAVERELELTKQKFIQFQSRVEEERRNKQEQIQVYHKKIVMLETQQQMHSEQTQKLRQQLEQLLKDNGTLQKQLQKITEAYETKIKQIDEMITNFKALQQSQQQNIRNLNKKSQNIRSLENELESLKNSYKSLSKQHSVCATLLQESQQQVEKLKEISLLNGEDLQMLRNQMSSMAQAYTRAEEQLQQQKVQNDSLTIMNDSLHSQLSSLKKQSQNLSNEFQNIEIEKQKIQREYRNLQNSMQIKQKQMNWISKQNQNLKQQIQRVKKQLNEFRSSNTELQSELRLCRQQMQRKIQSQSLDSGKRKLQLQACRIELRKKNQQLEKIKQSYEQKIQMLEAKNKQLTQFISHKQLLARISNNHVSQ